MRLSGPDSILKIELGNFGHCQRDELIACLRAAISDDRQVGWSEFQRQFQDSPERRMRTRRATWAISLVLALHAIAFMVLWVLRLGHQYLFIAIANAAFLVYFHRGIRNRRLASENGEPTVAPQIASRRF